MTYLPVCPRSDDAERAASADPGGRLAQLIRRIPGEIDLDSIERLALSEGFYNDSDTARRAISQAIASGWVIPRSAFLAELRSHQRTHRRQASGSIGAVGILSSGRWNVVAKSAAGIISGEDFPELAIPLVICDDSETTPDPVLRSLRGSSSRPTQLSLIGREERERFRQELLASPELRDADRSALSFGLSGSAEWICRAGANRNWWLLESAGDRSVLVDDDMGPEYLTYTNGEHAVRASSGFHPLRFRPLDEGHAFSTATHTASFVQVHADTVGRFASDLLVGDESEVDLSSCGGQLAHSLLKLDPAVAVSAAGVAGHPGWASRRMLWYLEGSDRKRAVEDRQAYRNMSASPSVLWSADHLTVSHSPFCRAGCAGFDGSRVLPPFPPVGRNSDGLIGLVIHRCFAPGSIAHVPIGVVHRRPPAKEHSPFAFAFTTNDYLSLILQDHDIPHGIDSESMSSTESLGSYLAECALAPPAHFADYVAELSHEQANAEYHSLAALLDHHHGRPKWWAREVQQRLAMIDRHTRENAVDVSDVAGPNRLTRINRLQTATRMYGELLQMWPTIYLVARRLRKSGRQPSRPLFSKDSG